MSTYCVTSAVLGARDAEWARSLLSWGFSGSAGYTGTSSPSRDVHTSLVPILQRRQEPELREECSQGPFWQRQSGGSDLHLPPVPSRQPLLATPSPGQGTRALRVVLLALSCITFSFSFCAPATSDTPHHPIVPRACPSCMAKASGTRCFPCLSSCVRLLVASPC